MKSVAIALLALSCLATPAQAFPISFWFHFNGGSGTWTMEDWLIPEEVTGGYGSIREGPLGPLGPTVSTLSFLYGGREWNSSNASLTIGSVQLVNEVKLYEWIWESNDPDYAWGMRANWDWTTGEYRGLFVHGDFSADGFEWGYGEPPSVDEPSGLWLVGLGMAALGLKGLRRVNA